MSFRVDPSLIRRFGRAEIALDADIDLSVQGRDEPGDGLIMKKILFSSWIVLSLSLGVLLQAQGPAPAAGEEPARVTFTVLKFNPWAAGSGAPLYTDATAELAPHPFVRSSGDTIYPTFYPRKAVDFEVRIKSLDPRESYTPIAVTFQQNPRGNCAKNDPIGAINFNPAKIHGSILRFHDNFLIIGPESRYEFFVVIRRASDGAIGVIDPGIQTDAGE